MKEISLIAVVDENFGLGKENRLLCHLPADLKHFKTLTLGKTILMGRKTFESIGKPLPHRFNIVLSHKKIDFPQVHWVSSLEKALALNPDDKEFMIIGGASIYRQTLEFATKIYLTKVHHQFDADTFFPTLDSREWIQTESIFREKDEKNNYPLTFCQYKRIKL